MNNKRRGNYGNKSQNKKSKIKNQKIIAKNFKKQRNIIVKNNFPAYVTNSIKKSRLKRSTIKNMIFGKVNIPSGIIKKTINIPRGSRKIP